VVCGRRACNGDVARSPVCIKAAVVCVCRAAGGTVGPTRFDWTYTAQYDGTVFDGSGPVPPPDAAALVSDGDESPLAHIAIAGRQPHSALLSAAAPAVPSSFGPLPTGVGGTERPVGDSSSPPAGPLVTHESPTAEQLPLDRLMRRDPILAFAALPLWEDDLHDHGVVECGIKFRVMEGCWLLLLRHYLRIDRHRVRLRDVRWFGELLPHVTPPIPAAQLPVAGLGEFRGLRGGGMTADRVCPSNPPLLLVLRLVCRRCEGLAAEERAGAGRHTAGSADGRRR